MAQMKSLRRHPLLRSSDESGFSLAEILVAMGILAIIMAGVTTVILRSSETSKNYTEATMSQGELLDSMSHVTRQVALAKTITLAGTDYVQMESIENGQSIRTTFFYYDPAKTVDPRFGIDEGLELPKFAAIMEYREQANETGTDVLRILVNGYTPNTSKPLFSYFDRTNKEILVPSNSTTGLNASELGAIERIAINLVSYVEGRQQANGEPIPMELSTSATPRLALQSGSSVSDLEPPAAPVLRGTLPPSTRTAELNWSNIAGATSYILFRSNPNQTPTEQTVDINAAPFASSEPRYSDVDRAWGETYEYQVAAVGPGGISGKSNLVSLTVVPEQPNFININPKSHTPTSTSAQQLNNVLNWTPRTGAIGYRLFRGTTMLYEGPNTSYIDRNRMYGDVLNYTVLAYNTGNNGSGGESTTSPPVTLISPPVAPPLSGRTEDGNRFLTWTRTDNTTVYQLQRRTSENPTWTQIYSGTNLSYTDVDTINASIFDYQVRSGNDAGWSEFTSVSLNPRPVAPTLSGVSNDGNNVLTWNAVANATTYQLYRNGSPIGTAQEGTTFTDNNPGWSSTHDYRVVAINKTGTSPQSNIVQLKQMPGPFSVNADNWRQTMFDENYGGRVTPRWGTSANANGYNVFRTAHSTDLPFGRSQAYSYNSSARNDAGQFSPLYPTAIYTYVVRATAGNGTFRDVSFTLQAPPELPRQMRQDTYYRTANGAAMYGEFAVWSNPNYGSKTDTVVSNYGGTGAAITRNVDYFVHTNSQVSINVGSINAISIRNRRTNISAVDYNFNSRDQVFGVIQSEDGNSQMRANPQSSFALMDPGNAPAQGYYAPWGNQWSQWKTTGIFGPPAEWNG